jgi:hypothetical protein
LDGRGELDAEDDGEETRSGREQAGGDIEHVRDLESVWADGRIIGEGANMRRGSGRGEARSVGLDWA